MKRKWEERLKAVEERASYYERNPLRPVYKPKLSQPFLPSPVWKLFCHQSEAFSYLQTCQEDVHVFALEKTTQSGPRFYLVTTYKELWFYYTKGYKTSLMHCYEVIPEKEPCKLYFDLEFYRATNPGAAGKVMVAKLIELVSHKLKELYDVNCSAEDVLNLDSSTDEKFSRHLIFLPAKTVFKDNINVGHFVRSILQPAMRLMESEAAAVVPGGESTAQCSAGAASDGPLSYLAAVEGASKGCAAIACKAKDMETSQQGQNWDFSFLVVKGKEGDKQLFVDLGVYTRNRNFRMYKSSKAGKNVILKIAEDNKFVPTCEGNISLEEAYFLSSLVCNVRLYTAFALTGPLEGHLDSPYPEIDAFVRSLVNKDGVQGGIRRWTYFSLEEMLVYDISGYRWCENIGRAHRSNNIMILVDLKEETWYQKCHDPACRENNFKSPSSPLPPGICLLCLFKERKEDPPTTLSDWSQSSGSLQRSQSQDILWSGSEWDNASDDAHLLEATEDVELAEAVDESLNCALEEIPDEVLLATL
ncbi:PRIPO protein, partial [Rhinopomastus cyanomelas]|nr:PRIPO protein [Rhinopomastus cyanomelas]